MTPPPPPFTQQTILTLTLQICYSIYLECSLLLFPHYVFFLMFLPPSQFALVTCSLCSPPPSSAGQHLDGMATLLPRGAKLPLNSHTIHMSIAIQTNIWRDILLNCRWWFLFPSGHGFVLSTGTDRVRLRSTLPCRVRQVFFVHVL